MALGEKLKFLRDYKGINQKEVADYIGVGVSAYSQYENNIRKPDYNILGKIAKFYQSNYDFLLDFEDDFTDSNSEVFKLVFYRYVEVVKNIKILMLEIDKITGAKQDWPKYKYLLKTLKKLQLEYDSSLKILNQYLDINNFGDVIEEYLEDIHMI